MGYGWVTLIGSLQTLLEPFENIILASRINYDYTVIPLKLTIY